MSNLPLFNWTQEEVALQDFFANLQPVLHISGSNDSHFNHFTAVIDRLRTKGLSIGTILEVDLLNQATASPLGLAEAICHSLNIRPSPVSPPELQNTSASVASNLRARGDIHIYEINQAISSSKSEGELLANLVRGAQEARGRGLNVSGCVVLVRQCHELPLLVRKVLWSTIWVPLISPLLACGLKVVFVYCDREIALAPDAIPPRPDKHIRLPEGSGHFSTEEVARFVKARGLVTTMDQALGYASAILATSSSVREIYENLGRAELSMG